MKIYAEKDENTLLKIKEIEREAYAGTDFAQMQDCYNWEDMADYLECSIDEICFLCTDSYYVLVAEHDDYAEIADLACRPDKRCDLKKVAEFIEEFDKPLTLDSRELTSYPILKYMEKRGRAVIMEDEIDDWNGERYHSMRIVTTKALERDPSICETKETDYDR